MNDRSRIPSVGAPDPELRNSPIVEDTEEDYDEFTQEASERPVCYFNNASYAMGEFVCSGSGELLRCENGLWVREGTCDPENP